MSRALATLSIDLEARLAKFEQGMDRAGRLLEKLNAGATTARGRIGEIFAGNLAADAAAQVFQRLVTFFPQVADGVLAIKDLSEATGSSVENISALDDIARRSGDSLQAVEGVLIKFNAALKEADGKNGVSQALQALGLNAKELRDLDPAEALQRTAQALNGFADDGNRARLTQELFGKGVKDAATFLRDLAEAGQLNATVTTAQAEEVDKFNKSIANLQANIQGLARTALGELLPKVNEVFDRLASLREVYGSIGSGLLAGLSVKSFYDAAEGVKFYTGEVDKLQRLVDKYEKSGNFFSRLNIGSAKEDLAAAQKALEFYQRTASKGGKLTGGEFTYTPDLGKAKLPALADASKLKEAKSSFEDYQQTLTKGLADLINKTDTVKLAELNAQFDKLTELANAGLDPKIVEQVQRLLVPPAGANSGPPIPETLVRVNELVKQTDGSKLKGALTDVALLNAELSRTDPNSARADELRDALFEVQSQVTDLSGTFPAFFDQVDAGAQQTADLIEGTLGGSIRSALSGNFRDIEDMWKNLLLDMAAQAVAANIADALFGQRGTNGARVGGGLVDVALKFLLSAKGNAFGPGGVYAFAGGGVVDSATPFTFGGGKLGVMGEAGPEGILPLRRGRDGKLGVTASGMGGGLVINQQINVQAGASRNEMMMAATAAKDAAVAEIMEMKRRGRGQP